MTKAYSYIGTSALARILNDAGLLVTADQLQKMCIRGTLKATRPTYANNRMGHWKLELAPTFHALRRFWGNQLSDKEWLELGKALKAEAQPLYRKREAKARPQVPQATPLLDLLEGTDCA